MLVLPGVCNALSLEIKASPKVRAYIGEQVTLKCSFKSSSPITESLTVDWTYRPLTGGQMETVGGIGRLSLVETGQALVHAEYVMIFFLFALLWCFITLGLSLTPSVPCEIAVVFFGQKYSV